MRSESETVIPALLADPEVSGIITDQIYPDQPPSEAVFPCVTYSESQTPAGNADNLEAATSVVFNFECYRRGSGWPLAMAVNDVMLGLGYSRVYTNDAGMAGPVHQVSSQYRKLKEG